MYKIYILSNDIKFVRSTEIQFDRSNYRTEVLNVKPEELFNYIYNHPTDFILVHNTYLNGFYQLFDMLLNANKCSIIYITPNLEEGAVYNAMSSPRFYMINQDRLSSLPDLINLMERDRKIIEITRNNLEAYKDKVDEERFVKRAKLYLMKQFNITEDEAYRRILKKSMDERISKLQVAKNILGGR